MFAILNVEVGNVVPSPLTNLQVYAPFLSNSTVGAAERTFILPETSSFCCALVVPIPTLPSPFTVILSPPLVYIV